MHTFFCLGPTSWSWTKKETLNPKDCETHSWKQSTSEISQNEATCPKVRGFPFSKNKQILDLESIYLFLIVFLEYFSNSKIWQTAWHAEYMADGWVQRHGNSDFLRIFVELCFEKRQKIYSYERSSYYFNRVPMEPPRFECLADRMQKLSSGNVYIFFVRIGTRA